MKKQYFRMTVDRMKGKYAVHSATFTSQPSGTPIREDVQEQVVRPDHTFVDEVVIGGGVLHLEAMDRRTYWVNVAGVTLWLRLRKDGSVKQVTVFGPDDYDGPREGVKYEVQWGGLDA